MFIEFLFSSLLLNSVLVARVLHKHTHACRTRSENFRIRKIRARGDLLSRMSKSIGCAHRIDCNVQLRLICNCLMFLAGRPVLSARRPLAECVLNVKCISTNSNERSEQLSVLVSLLITKVWWVEGERKTLYCYESARNDFPRDIHCSHIISFISQHFAGN